MKKVFGVIGIIILAYCAWYVLTQYHSAPAAPQSQAQPINTVTFACAGDKSITAAFYNGSSTQAAPDQPPVPGGHVNLTISDGRTMTLPQTISADGARYANADESFVFWNKGNGVAVTENNQPSYMCVAAASDPGGLPHLFKADAQAFSIRYPDGFTVNKSYVYSALGPSKETHGVSLTIPTSTAQGTNLSNDTYVSVESIPRVENCDASLFLDPASKVVSSTFSSDEGTYSVASSTGAGAGNRYEETVYAVPGTNPCVAVRYFIHYGVLENYPQGAVHAFDHVALLAEFDKIRKTLVLGE